MSSGATDMDYETHRIEWQGIEIEIRYCPIKWGVISHLEIESIRPERVPLPITETGYLSHHCPPHEIESQGGDVTALVRAFLDERAKASHWQEHLEVSRQGELF